MASGGRDYINNIYIIQEGTKVYIHVVCRKIEQLGVGVSRRVQIGHVKVGPQSHLVPGPEMIAAEAAKAYDCILPDLQRAYRKSGNSAAMASAKWRRYSRVAYPSATHGGRLVNNYANEASRKYAGFENAGKMPKGAVLAKDSFSVSKTGALGVGPLFIMEKMAPGFSKASGDWRYTMIMPDGSIFGVTNGKGAARMKFCAECHAAVGETQDHMFFLPAEFRVK